MIRRLLYTVFVCAALWGLHLAQPYAAPARVPIVALLLASCYAAQGLLHGAFYSRDRLFGGVHFTADVLGGLLVLMAWAAGVPVLVLAGSALAGDFLFQLPINHAAGRPLVYGGETGLYMSAGADWSFKHLFYGRVGRWLELTLGLVLVFVGLILPGGT